WKNSIMWPDMAAGMKGFPYCSGLYNSRMLRFSFLAFLLLLSPLLAQAQQVAPSPLPTPAGLSNAEAATRAWLATVSPQEKTRSDAYFEGGYWLLLWRFLVSAGILLLLLATKLSAHLRIFAGKLTRSLPLQAALYGLGFALFTWAL